MVFGDVVTDVHKSRSRRQVNMPEVHLASMSADELAKYKALLLELRALVPKDEPKRIGGMRR
jgi:hypothetical protein